MASATALHDDERQGGATNGCGYPSNGFTPAPSCIQQHAEQLRSEARRRLILFSARQSVSCGGGRDGLGLVNGHINGSRSAADAIASIPQLPETEASQPQSTVTQFMTKDDLARMRQEMRETGRQRQREQAKQRADMDSDCPLFLSLRLRRMLEFAFGLRPAGVALATGAERTVEPLALEDGVAIALADITIHHKFPPACVRCFLEETPQLRPPLRPPVVASQFKRDVLARMRLHFREDPPGGVDWNEPLSGGVSQRFVPSSLDCGSGTSYGVSGFSNEDVVVQQKRGQERLLPRAWFGVDADDGGDRETSTILRRLTDSDSSLPIAKHKADICRMVRESQITLVQGETGCGKTTQVPKFILEAALQARAASTDSADRRRPVRIIVTQPRRIAAITVAKRVADELGEKVGEGIIGYKIRGTTVAGPRCRVLFCTTGVVLRRLANEGKKWMFSPETVTHLVVDEVHERGVDTDFMLTFLREVQASRPRLRVVLMSATMDTECFRRYFTLSTTEVLPSGEIVPKVFEPPTVYCPAFCHPVEIVYMEGMQRRLGRESFAEARSADDLRRSAGDSDGIDYDLVQQVIEELEKSPDGAWTFSEIHDTGDGVAHRPKDPTKGAVLIFLPGLGEITQMMTALQEHSSMSSKWWVLPLHANLPPEDQQTCFQTTLPAGCTRKIICATNVAETSVTVPDVTVVIDSCRERRNQVDKNSNTPMLREQWCAKDSLKQRRGRAGRVMPGVCFRLLPEANVERLPDVTPPEMKRVPLENVYLQVCASGIHDRPAFLAKTPDPPDESAVLFAELALSELGALDETEDDGLTPMGRHLASLPCHPRLGKILVLGCLLGVPSPCLSICAAMSLRNPMLTTQDKGKRNAWQAARTQLVEQIGTRSDHCVWAHIMQEWRFGDTRQRDLCRNLGLSFERMCSSVFERKHLCEALVQVGLLPGGFLRNEWEESDRLPDWSLVRSAVVGGLYPNILRVERRVPKYQTTNAGERAKWLSYTMFQRHHVESMSYGKSVNLHPNSLCFGVDQYHCPYLAFYTIQQTTKLYAYDITEVNPYALLLFGANPVFDKTTDELEIGRWARFRCPDGESILPLICAARRSLHAVLRRKLDDVKYDLKSSQQLRAIAELLRTNGLGLRPPSPPPIIRERAFGVKKEDEFDEAENEVSYMMRKDKESETLTRAAWTNAKRTAAAV
eukprot:TRINITY_DN43372_c0_g1_i1.p1 TRINITY_DN43372_c0_g1~~TRINITY_DN43372_c0_g1_i1.p1  ORF type:complete len:1193 (-),score=186.31 TRINITY_DN43372_c0_g1_i1:182-3760(-)